MINDDQRYNLPEWADTVSFEISLQIPEANWLGT